MESLPADLCMKVFSSLDHHQDLVAAHQVCRKWKLVASEDELWSNLFKQRWGIDRATFYAPVDSKSWKDVYAVQDRCDRVGLGLKIVREGDDYFLIHQGQIQKHLGSKRLHLDAGGDITGSRSERQMGILDRILFFVGDLETDSASTQRGRRFL
ncbi:uncharacterized protein LOC143566200 [Bidens hawaiensis]|uniref:uncharacterized protein LOC143566200 n=1 Tax=Bidens hawaiensis TaxID=980011 RepID=UPI00404B5829